MPKIKQPKLDPQEQETLNSFEEAFEAKSLKSIDNVNSEVKRYRDIAKAAGNKSRRVSLRMTEWDFNKAQETALREGIPYQTFLSSIIHKYLSGSLISKNNKSYE